MREVEVKAHIRDEATLLKKLKEQGGELGEPKVQEDTVYVKEIGTMQRFLANDHFLRIRKMPEHVMFTLKYHPGRNTTNVDAMPIEHEVVVSSSTELESMLGLLGFVKALQINKTRRTTHALGYEICIDEVEGLGAFIEVEKLLEHDEDTEPTLQEMKLFLQTLGIATEDIGVKRYDVQLLEKEYGSI
jgi:adenylate cyclase class 2